MSLTTLLSDSGAATILIKVLCNSIDEVARGG
jgi:hypothetical protein